MGMVGDVDVSVMVDETVGPEGWKRDVLFLTLIGDGNNRVDP